jgi:glycosyltransferase involved in cell wall biosynthesis
MVEAHKIKLLLIFNSLEIGGIENRIIDITNHISKNHPEIQVSLCLKKPNGSLAQYLPPGVKKYYPSQNYPRVFQALRYPFWLIRPISQIKPDLILCFGNYSAIAGVIAQSLSTVSRTAKVIISEDSSIIEQLQTDSYSWLRSQLVKLTYPKADKIITLSPAGQKKLLEFMPSLAPNTVVFPVWLPHRFLENISSTKVKKDIDILFLGRFVPQKNPLRFIRIIKLVTKVNPNLKSVMVGYGPLQPQMEQLIRQLHLKSNIQILPATTTPAEYYQRSKIFLLSSDHEGFPVVLLEANACDCVPVMRHLKEISQYYRPHANYLFFKTPQKASELISRLLHHPQIRRKIAQHYRRLVVNNQSIFTKDFISLIKSVL